MALKFNGWIATVGELLVGYGHTEDAALADATAEAKKVGLDVADLVVAEGNWTGEPLDPVNPGVYDSDSYLSCLQAARRATEVGSVDLFLGTAIEAFQDNVEADLEHLVERWAENGRTDDEDLEALAELLEAFDLEGAAATARGYIGA